MREEHRSENDADVTPEKIGEVDQRVMAGREMIIKARNRVGKLRAFIKPEFRTLITPGMFMVAETLDSDGGGEKILYACTIDVAKIGDNVIEDKFRITDRYPRTLVELDPQFDMVKYPDGRIELKHPPRLHRADLQPIRLPSEKELRVILGLQDSGAKLGYATGATMSINSADGNFQRVPYRHPLDNESYGYTGFLVIGKQGFGKTTFGRVLVKSFSEWKNPPAIVIADGEGEFLHIDEKNPDLTGADEGMLSDLDLNSPCDNVEAYRISKEGVNGTHTLAASMLRSEDIPMFLPELPPKSRDAVADVCRNMTTYQMVKNSEDYGLTLEDMMSEIDSRLYNIHPQSRQAIKRAIGLAPTHLFDCAGEPLNPKKLLVPGKVSVISDSEGFYDNEQGLVGLYLTLTLGRIKIDERLDRVPVVLVLDEATRRLPTRKENKYIRDRVTDELWKMVHVGRKRGFMPVMMTQHHRDIPKDIRDLCGVQVLFQTNILGNASWLKQKLKPYKKSIEHLDVGEALVDSGANKEVIRLQVPRSPVRER